MSGAKEMVCRNCLGERWVCENHMDRPFTDGIPEGCECGAGAPCPVCCPEMANAGLIGEVEKWRSLTDGLVSEFDWNGCTCTFQSDDCCSYAKASAALEQYRTRTPDNGAAS